MSGRSPVPWSAVAILRAGGNDERRGPWRAAPSRALGTSGVCSLGTNRIVWVAGVEEVGVRLGFSFPELMLPLTFL